MGITMSPEGMNQLATLAGDQYLNLSEAHGFLGSQALSNTGGFTGLLAMFKGTYEETLAAADEGMGAAVEGALALKQSIANARTRLMEEDANVERELTTLTVRLQEAAHTPRSDQEAPLPELPPNVVNTNNVAGFPDLPGGVPTEGLPESVAPKPSLGAPLDFYNEGQGLTDQSNNTGEALRDGREMNEFIEENR